MKTISEHELTEKFAALAHLMWMRWAGTLIEGGQVCLEKKTSWETHMVPYDKLGNNMKELDRVWARQMVDIVKSLGGKVG